MIYKLSGYTILRFAAFFVLMGEFLNKSYLLVYALLFQFCLYVINSFLFDIRINDGTFFIGNLYRKDKIVPGSEFNKIEKVRFVYLFAMMLSVTFYVLKLKDAGKFSFLSNSAGAYFSLFTFGLYCYYEKLSEIVEQKPSVSARHSFSPVLSLPLD